MTDAVIVAAIGGVTTLTAALAAALATIKAKRLEIAAKDEAKAAADAAAISRRQGDRIEVLERAVVRAGSAASEPPDLGYTMEGHRGIWQLGDDGLAISTKEYVGLRAHQRFQNFSIPFRAPVWGFEGKNPPPELRQVSPLGLPARVEHSSLRVNEGSVEGQVVIDGVFGPESGRASFTLGFKHERCFALTLSEARRIFATHEWKKDYLGLLNPFFVEWGELIVEFPRRFHGRIEWPQAIAFLEGTETLHALETARISQAGALDFDGMRARLRIERPVRGLMYAISWLPPEA